MTSKENLQENLDYLAKPNIGRFVVVSLSEDNNWRLFGGMGGRSAGSKNRYYEVYTDMNGHGDFLRTAVNDPSLQKGDPAATLYIAQRERSGWHVVSNGEQTEGISVALSLGEIEQDRVLVSSVILFDQAQKLYKNEGKDNAYTSRISVAVRFDGKFALMGKIVQKPDSPEDSNYKYYVLHNNKSAPKAVLIQPGEGYFIATYNGEGGTDPDYSGPRKILLPGNLEESMDILWNKWDPNTKSGLAGKEIERGSGRFAYAFRSIHPGRTGYQE